MHMLPWACEGLDHTRVKPHDVGIFEELTDVRSLSLTANSTPMYVMTCFDLRQAPMRGE